MVGRGFWMSFTLFYLHFSFLFLLSFVSRIFSPLFHPPPSLETVKEFPGGLFRSKFSCYSKDFHLSLVAVNASRGFVGKKRCQIQIACIGRPLAFVRTLLCTQKANRNKNTIIVDIKLCHVHT